MAIKDLEDKAASEKVVVKARKPREKKFDKFSDLFFIPRSVLNEKQINKNARIGFQTYKSLTCQHCKISFHKRSGLQSHTIEIHGGNNLTKKKSHNSTAAKFNKRDNLTLSTVQNTDEDDISILEELSSSAIVHSTPNSSISDKIDDDSGVADIESSFRRNSRSRKKQDASSSILLRASSRNKDSDFSKSQSIVLESSVDEDIECLNEGDDSVILSSTPKSSSFEKIDNIVNDEDSGVEEESLKILRATTRNKSESIVLESSMDEDIECLNVINAEDSGVEDIESLNVKCTKRKSSLTKNEDASSPKILRTTRRKSTKFSNSTSKILESTVDENIEVEMVEPSSSMHHSTPKSSISDRINSHINAKESDVKVNNNKQTLLRKKNASLIHNSTPKLSISSRIDSDVDSKEIDVPDGNGEDSEIVIVNDEEDSGVVVRKRSLRKNKDPSASKLTQRKSKTNFEIIESNMDEQIEVENADPSSSLNHHSTTKSSSSGKMNPVVLIENIGVESFTVDNTKKSSLRKDEELLVETPVKKYSNSKVRDSHVEVEMVEPTKKSGRKSNKVSKVNGRKRKANSEEENDGVVKFSAGEWEWMIDYPMFTPEIWLAGDLNKALRASKDEDDSDVEMLDQEEVVNTRNQQNNKKIKYSRSKVKSPSPLNKTISKNNNEKDVLHLTEVSRAVDDIPIVDLESDGEDEEYILDNDEVDLFKDKIKTLNSVAPEKVHLSLNSEGSDDDVECVEL